MLIKVRCRRLVAACAVIPMEAVSKRGPLPEVNDLHDVGIQGEVVGFDIPVHISMTMNMRQPARHLIAHLAKVESSVTRHSAPGGCGRLDRPQSLLQYIVTLPLRTRRLWQARPQNSQNTTTNKFLLQ